MAFDIAGAKQAGYDDSEIADFLAKENNFDISSARNSGYNDSEIINELSQKKQLQQQAEIPAQQIQPEEPKKSFMQRFPQTPEEMTKAYMPPTQVPEGQFPLNPVEEAKSIARPTPITETTPQWGRDYPTAYNVVSKVAHYTEPTRQMLGLLGTPVSAGLTHGMERETNKWINNLLGKEQPQTVGQSLLKGAQNFAYGYGTQGIGDWVTNLLSKTKRVPGALYDKYPNNAPIDLEQVKQQSKDLGIKLMPSEEMNSPTLSQIEGTMSRLYGSGGVVRNEKIKQIQQSLNLYNQLLEKNESSLSLKELGQKIQADFANNLNEIRSDAVAKYGTKYANNVSGLIGKEAIKEGNKKMYGEAQRLYTERDALIPGNAQVEMNNLKSISKRLLGEMDKMPYTERDSNLYDRLMEFSGEKTLQSMPFDVSQASPEIRKQMMGAIGKEVPSFDIQTINNIKSNFDKELVSLNPALANNISPAGIKGLTKQGQSFEVKAYAYLRNAMERDINDFAKVSAPGLTEATQKAHQFYGPFKKFMNSREVKSMLRSNPEDLVDTIVRPNGVTEIDAAKKIMGSNFDKFIKPALTNKILGVEVNKIYDPLYTLNELNRLQDPVLNMIYQPEELAFLKSAAMGSTDLGKYPLNAKFIQSISETDPETLAKGLLQGNTSKYLSRNYRILNNFVKTDTKKAIAYELTKNIFSKGQVASPMGLTEGAGDLATLDLNTLSKSIKKYEDVIGLVYSQSDIDLLKKISNIGMIMKSSGQIAINPSGTGQAIGQMAQSGMVVHGLLSGNIPLATGAAFGPYAFSKLYFNPVGRMLLRASTKIPLASPQAAGLITKMGMLIAQPEDEIIKQKKEE